MGSPVEIHEPPDACFQSGPNLSCGDAYENAAVSEYCNVGYGRGRAERISPRQIGVAYQQLINGSVSEIKVFKEEYRLKVGNFWYIVSKDDNSDFLAKVAVGSMVSLTTYGCAGNELACDAAPTKH